MSQIFSNRLIGFGDVIRALQNQAVYDSKKTKSYPPYDIYSNEDETVFTIQLALAGFRREDVQVNFRDGKLSITGNRASDEDPGMRRIHSGISSRSFDLSWQLATGLKVESAKMQDGILSVSIVAVAPAPDYSIAIS